MLIGSHIDTVRNAGRYDGCLGVVAGIEAVAELQRRGKRLAYSVEVLAFGDEEGVRFPATLSGSRTVAGGFDLAALDAVDSDGVSLRAALESFGCDPTRLKATARDQAAVLGYIEMHIEQGPVLESEGQAVGVVTAISGASRLQVAVTGMAGHAGTLPMAMRRDALAASAEMILSVESTGRSSAGLVRGLSARSRLRRGAVNVVPGSSSFTIDARSPVDRTRRACIRQIERDLKAIARRRQCSVQLTETYNESAVTCDRRFIREFSSAIERSGAGGDGLAERRRPRWARNVEIVPDRNAVSCDAREASATIRPKPSRRPTSRSQRGS